MSQMFNDQKSETKIITTEYWRKLKEKENNDLYILRNNLADNKITRIMSVNTNL